MPDDHRLPDRFGDIDELAEATRGWNLDFLQLDCGEFRAGFNQVVTAATILVECSFSRKLEQRGSPPPGYRTFGFAADARLDLRWRGKPVRSQDLMLFPPGGSLDSISQPGFHVYAFSVSNHALMEAAMRRGVGSVEELFPATDLLSCSDEIMADIRYHAKLLSRNSAIHPDLLSSRPSTEELALIDGMLDAISTPESKSQPPATIRSRAVKKAIDIISDRADEPVSIAEIAKLTGVTDRALRYGFEENYGISPKQYLQAYRFNQVHRLLRRAQAEGQNISDVANAWGFWHMGQFARDYRKMFGVLPGQTLNSD